MVPLQDEFQQQITISVSKFLLTMVSVTLQHHVVLFLQLTFHYQGLKQQASEAIQDKNCALYRYLQLQNKYLRKKKCNWKSIGHRKLVD